MGKTPQTGMPRWFTESRRLCAVKPVVLADIGEGELLFSSSFGSIIPILTPSC